MNAIIIKAVMSSAAEAETGALYLNAKEAVYLQQILEEMGHPQPKTPIQTDNTTAEGVINNKIPPKPWTCDFIGYAIAKHRGNLKFIGGRGRPTSQTILRSTICWRIMSM